MRRPTQEKIRSENINVKKVIFKLDVIPNQWLVFLLHSFCFSAAASSLSESWSVSNWNIHMGESKMQFHSHLIEIYQSEYSPQHFIALIRWGGFVFVTWSMRKERTISFAHEQMNDGTLKITHRQIKYVRACVCQWKTHAKCCKYLY